MYLPALGEAGFQSRLIPWWGVKTNSSCQQVRVDEESAALQRPETAEVVRQAERDAESAQLQTQGAGNAAADRLPPVRHTGGTGQMPKRGLGKVLRQETRRTRRLDSMHIDGVAR